MASSCTALVLIAGLVAQWAHLAQAHSILFCAATAPSEPGGLKVILGTYHRLTSHARGEMVLAPEQGTSVMTTLTQTCRGQVQKGSSCQNNPPASDILTDCVTKGLVPSDAIITCYGAGPDDSVVPVDSCDAVEQGSYRNIGMYAVGALSGFSSGTVKVTVQHTDMNFNPNIGSSGALVRRMGQARGVVLGISVAQAGKPCPTAPVVSNSQDLSSCNNAFDGFLCDVPCVAGFVPSGGGFMCNNGTYQATEVVPACVQTCAQAYHPCQPGYIQQSANAPATSQDFCCLPTCAVHTCPDGHISIQKKMASTAVSDAECCEKTCAAFDCPAGYALNPDMLSSAPVSQQACCVETCSRFSCPANYVPDASKENSTTWSQTECCLPTCATLSCQANFVPDVAKSSSTDVRQENCCLPSCASFKCPLGYGPNPANSQATTLDYQTCCAPSCASYTCPAFYVPKQSAMSSITLDTSNCCEGTCQSYTCSSGFVVNSEQAASTLLTDASCCLKTCAGFTCLPGYVNDPAFAQSTIVSTKACCKLDNCQAFTCPVGFREVSGTPPVVSQTGCCVQECSSFQCPDGYSSNVANSASTTISVSNCCEKTCATFGCSDGYVANPAQSSSTTLSRASCCEATCATFACPVGYVLDPAGLASTSLSVSSCCLATCATFSCPANYIAQPLLALSTTVTQGNCCQATCATFTCPADYVANPDRVMATELTQESCCQATCATFTCPTGFVANVSNSASTLVYTEGCCTAQCSALSVCPAGYVEDGAHFGTSSDECCLATCAVFPCPDGQVSDSSQATATNVSVSTCCQDTCALFTCPTDYVPNPAAVSSTNLTTEICCEATCGTFTCPANYLAVEDSNSITVVSLGSCCSATCATLTCPAGTHAIAHRQTDTLATESHCCEDTCASFQCYGGFVVDPAQTSSTTVSVDNCCRPTCALFACPTSYVADPAKAALTDLSASGCCQPTCAAFPCPSGYLPDLLASASTAVSTETCCDATCATLSCPLTYVPDLSMITSTVVNQETCCDATCASLACNSGYAPVLDQETSTNVSQSNCCEPTCAVFQCPTGFITNPANQSSTNLEVASCCLPTCATLLCPAGWDFDVGQENSTDVTVETCCESCPAGSFKTAEDPVSGPGYLRERCTLCLPGFWNPLTGQAACSACPENWTTPAEGATNSSECTCKEGFYKDDGFCISCMANAVCPGADFQPHSSWGHWSPDARTFWSCFPSDSCLEGSTTSTNACADGRAPDGVRCVPCAADHYMANAECHQCSGFQKVLSIVGRIVLVIALLAIMVILRWEAATDVLNKSFREVCTHHKKKLGRLGQAMTMEAESTLFFSAIAVLQFLWVFTLFPNWQPSTGIEEVWKAIVTLAAFDTSVFTHCSLSSSFINNWFLDWSLHWAIVLVNIVLVLVQFLVAKDTKTHFLGIMMESTSFLIMLLVTARFHFDLIFVNCVACEDGRLCLAEDPLLYCGFQDGSVEWKTLAYVSIVDLSVWSLLIALVFYTMVRTWKWQCGEGEGVTSGGRVHWYVLFAEPWTKHLKGHSGALRLAVQDFPAFTEHLQTPASRKDVWRRFNSHVLEKKEQDMADLALKMVSLAKKNKSEGAEGADSDAPRRGTSAIRGPEHEHLDLDIADMAEKVQELYPKSKWFFLLELFWSCSWSWLRTVFRMAMTAAVMTLPKDKATPASSIGCTFVLLLLLMFAGLMKANRWEVVNDWEIILYALSMGVLVLLLSGDITAVTFLASVTVLVAVAPVILYLFAFAIRRCIANVEATMEATMATGSRPKSQGLEGIVQKSLTKEPMEATETTEPMEPDQSQKEEEKPANEAVDVAF
ncbi:UGT80B1 [Symbiodinium natans]|uniref:UGT80B1 protein n=1 Tax=Symbiodinium natans TaxID=878477 RepID=A0A812UAJ7_9DINO|nr:UGT80B1 [Symbiodinium natans]